jgi:hypothetical protein
MTNTIRTHAHTDHTDMTAHIIRSGYRTHAGATRWFDAHRDTAPTGWGYYVGSDTYTDGYAVWCAPLSSGADVFGTYMPTPPHTDHTYTDEPTVLATRYGVPITTVDPARSYVGTADGMGYASTGTNTYGAPTVPATDATPWFDRDTTDADTDPETGMSYLDVHGADTDTYAPTGTDAPVCIACGEHGVLLDTVAPGTYVTLHMHTGDGTGRTITRTIAGTVEHDTIDADTDDDGWTIVRIITDNGSWTTPRSDYIVHVATDTNDAPTADDTDAVSAFGVPFVATPSAPVDATDPADTDTYVSVFGRPVRAHVARAMGAVDPAPWVGMIPGRTYTGTSRHGTDYTVTTDGTVTTRTYADGTVTRADVNHMWYTDESGRTTTYVVAEGTYWQEVAEGTYDRVSSASWPMVATCLHDHGAYGACIAPIGHAGAHRDANGHTFTGSANARYAGTYGPVAPDTYTRVVTRVPFERDTYRTVLRDDVAAMVDEFRRTWAMWVGVAFPTVGAAYASLVREMELGTYEPSRAHYTAWADTLDAHYAIR